MNALLIHLQGKPRVRMEELEERFGTSRRTLFRDIRSLLEAGVPIGGNAGEGYFVVDGYHLPPVVFSKEEAAALLLGAKFFEQSADEQTTGTLKSAMYKVKSVLRFSDKEFLDNLESRIAIRPVPRQGQFPDSHIAALQLAVATNHVLKISYQSGLEKTTEREVEPLGMVFYSSHWHLIAYCRLRQDLRDFRADRIRQLQTLIQTFDPASHPDYLSFVHDSLIGTDALEVVIRTSPLVARFMGDQKYYQGFVEQRLMGDQVEMKFAVAHAHYFVRWLLSFGAEVSIVSPGNIKDLAAQISAELARHYSAELVTS